MQHRRRFRGLCLAVATALVFANDAMLTRVYGLIPVLLPDSECN